jgi:beta-galactosidase
MGRMARARIAERRIRVDDQSRALLSGEVHFWRLDPRVWPSVLARARELGLDMLSSYVCWDFHELAPGRFDLRGETTPRRDLLAFLELVREQGFWLVLRPGPYIYAEWPNSGVPERVVRWHRLHPSFQQAAAAWLAAVVDAARPFLATHGGPVVLLQADNEADPWIDVYAEQLGLGSRTGLFQEFLAGRYAHIAELNSAWESAYTDFSAARAVLSPVFRTGGYRERYLDVCRFRHWYASEIVRWTTAEFRRLGVDVPISANTYIGLDVQDWRSLEASCDLAGPDVYPTSRIAEDPHERRRMLDAVRFTRTYSALPFIAEFEAGIWHGWHTGVGTLGATHYVFNGLSALQAGACGWNWYMLAGRDSWYMSPITELGRLRPDLAPAFAGEAVRDGGDAGRARAGSGHRRRGRGGAAGARRRGRGLRAVRPGHGSAGAAAGAVRGRRPAVRRGAGAARELRRIGRQPGVLPQLAARTAGAASAGRDRHRRGPAAAAARAGQPVG